MSMTEHLVQGVDLWLNTPRRPWEASGTSGMKVLVNGGLNLSELDGWWAEAYTPDVGWAIGDGLEHDDDPGWDAAEAEQLYTLLEQEIVPAFYRRDEAGVPSDWVSKMRESMARLTPEFSATRSVPQYTANYYLPAANALRERSKDNSAPGVALLQWRRQVAEHWPRLRLADCSVDSDANRHVFHVQAYLDELDPATVRVELYAEGRTRPRGNGAGRPVSRIDERIHFHSLRPRRPACNGLHAAHRPVSPRGFGAARSRPDPLVQVGDAATSRVRPKKLRNLFQNPQFS